MKFSFRKLCVTGFVVVLFLGIMGNINKNNTYDKAEVDGSFYLETVSKLNEMAKVKVEEDYTYEKPEYDLKGLDKQWQDLIFQLCVKNNLSYELALAVMYQESKFNHKAINVNTNESRDGGLFQINNRFSDTYKNYAIQYCDFPEGEKFDVHNPDHNIRAGIGGLVHLKNKYESKGYGGDIVTLLTLGAYNRGEQGMKNYVSRGNSLETEYARKVLYYKENLERYGRIE